MESEFVPRIYIEEDRQEFGEGPSPREVERLIAIVQSLMEKIHRSTKGISEKTCCDIGYLAQDLL